MEKFTGHGLLHSRDSRISPRGLHSIEWPSAVIGAGQCATRLRGTSAKFSPWHGRSVAQCIPCNRVACLGLVQRLAFPHQPHAEVQHAGRIGQSCNYVLFDWNVVDIDLAIERFAERNSVVEIFVLRSLGLLPSVKPEFHSLKELKTPQLGECCACHVFSRSKEDGGCEHSLKVFDHAAIMRTILGKAEEIKNLSSA